MNEDFLILGNYPLALENTDREFTKILRIKISGTGKSSCAFAIYGKIYQQQQLKISNNVRIFSFSQIYLLQKLLQDSN